METYTPNKVVKKGQEVEEKGEEEGGVRIDGFGQVLDMLKVADPEFRASLLQRISMQDPQLAAKLAEHL